MWGIPSKGKSKALKQKMCPEPHAECCREGRHSTGWPQAADPWQKQCLFTPPAPDQPESHHFPSRCSGSVSRDLGPVPRSGRAVEGAHSPSCSRGTSELGAWAWHQEPPGFEGNCDIYLYVCVRLHSAFIRPVVLLDTGHGELGSDFSFPCINYHSAVSFITVCNRKLLISEVLLDSRH